MLRNKQTMLWNKMDNIKEQNNVKEQKNKQKRAEAGNVTFRVLGKGTIVYDTMH